MKTCPYCKAELDDSARFCLRCMTSLEEKEHFRPQRNKKPQWLIAVAVIVALAIVALIVLPALLEAPSQSSDTESTIPQSADNTTPPNTNPGAPDKPEPSPGTSPDTPIEIEPVIPPVTNPTTPPKQNPTTPPATSPNTPSDTTPDTPSNTETPSATEAPEITEVPADTEAPEITEVPADTEAPEGSSPTEPHEHSFSKNISGTYLLAEADCNYPAIYYYSCTCGATATETFYWGEAKGHTNTTESGYPATCETPGMTDKVYCSVCSFVVSPHMKIDELGHTFVPGPSLPSCLNCRKTGPIILQVPELPLTLKDTLCINSCSYVIRPDPYEAKWEISLYVNYTNISSATTSLSPDGSARWYENGRLNAASGDRNSGGTLQPDKSRTCLLYFRISNAASVYEIVFR